MFMSDSNNTKTVIYLIKHLELTSKIVTSQIRMQLGFSEITYPGKPNSSRFPTTINPKVTHPQHLCGRCSGHVHLGGDPEANPGRWPLQGLGVPTQLSEEKWKHFWLFPKVNAAGRTCISGERWLQWTPACFLVLVVRTMHSCKANGPRGKQVEECQRCSRENNSVQGSESCFFFFYWIFTPLGFVIAGQFISWTESLWTSEGSKGNGMHLQISLKGSQILLQKKRPLKEWNVN